MPDDETTRPGGIRQPSTADAAGGGEAEAAKLTADEPEDTETPLPPREDGPSEAATSDIEERQHPHAADEGRAIEDAPPS